MKVLEASSGCLEVQEASSVYLKVHDEHLESSSGLSGDAGG